MSAKDEERYGRATEPESLTLYIAGSLQKATARSKIRVLPPALGILKRVTSRPPAKVQGPLPATAALAGAGISRGPRCAPNHQAAPGAGSFWKPEAAASSVLPAMALTSRLVVPHSTDCSCPSRTGDERQYQGQSVCGFMKTKSERPAWVHQAPCTTTRPRHRLSADRTTVHPRPPAPGCQRRSC